MKEPHNNQCPEQFSLPVLFIHTCYVVYSVKGSCMHYSLEDYPGHPELLTQSEFIIL